VGQVQGAPDCRAKKIRNNFPVAVGETYNRFCVVNCTKMHSAARTAGGARALDPPDPRGLAVTGGGEEGLVIGRGRREGREGIIRDGKGKEMGRRGRGAEGSTWTSVQGPPSHRRWSRGLGAQPPNDVVVGTMHSAPTNSDTSGP